WLGANGMDPTPELSALMTHALALLMKAPKLVENLSEDEQTARVCSVGAVLLQLLAIQRELNEPFNLNGDLFLDITRDRVVVREKCQGLAALDLMLTELWDVRHGIATLMNFKKNHTVWIEDHPPLFQRIAPSQFLLSPAISVVLRSKKRARKGLIASKPGVTIVSPRKLRSGSILL
ncbi:hypothetical protein R3P38DRAFT_2519161, partial [Favolaschia claudopus]